MEIDKTLALPAPPAQVWALLLDPAAMAQCVPGMQSVEVVSPDEYTAVMQVKVAFVSARFTLRTRIVERREPAYLRTEGTGEDAAVASALRQTSEMFLDPGPDGGTTLRLRVQVDVVGRIASFGLAAMKTKADRLWDEFGVNLAARLGAAEAVAAPEAAPLATPPAVAPDVPPDVLPEVPAVAVAMAAPPPRTGLWSRLLAPWRTAAPAPIVIELRRPDQTTWRIEWPAAQSAECARWLERQLR